MNFWSNTISLNEQDYLKLLNSSIREWTRNKLTSNRNTFPIKVEVVCELVNSINKDEDKFRLEHNASFALAGSNQFVSCLREYLQTINLDGIPSKTLLVKLNIIENELSKNNKEADTFEHLPTFIPTKPKYNFSQVILSDIVKQEIMSALSVIKNRHLVYDVWGFGKVEPCPRSILNFYGPPGTGKSMCAHAIASELNQPLLALNYADIESKYVGEAAKNLKKAFETATELNAVMFFDEADSFLGKRVENVSSGSDQALNSLRSQMLIYLEEFSGVVLFATNLVTNFDKAFESRILNHIKFELPNLEARAAIIEKMLPKELPKDKEFSTEDFLSASELIDGLSGREIKTAIQSMLLNGAQQYGENAVFTIESLKNALSEKKASIEKLKSEEKLKLKEKVTKKLQEKNEEAKMEEEYKESVSKMQSQDTITPMPNTEEQK